MNSVAVSIMLNLRHTASHWIKYIQQRFKITTLASDTWISIERKSIGRSLFLTVRYSQY